MDLIEETKTTSLNTSHSSLEEKVANLEKDLSGTKELLHKLVILLENEYNRDIDGDGKIG